MARRRRMMRWIALLLVLYLALCGLVYWFQERLIFLPGPPPRMTPAALSLRFEEHRIATADGESLQAWTHD